MFTGIVERAVPVAAATRQGGMLSLRLPLAGVRKGDSVAVAGVCLTAAALQGGHAIFEVMPETLRKSTLGRLRAGGRVNVERSLRLGRRMGGHFVQGHVDGTGTVYAVRAEGRSRILWIRAPPRLLRLLVPKGSVAVDGVSLTVVEATRQGFSAALIPHTLQATTLGGLRAGDRVNLEADLLGKYLARYVQRHRRRLPVAVTFSLPR